MREQVSTDKAPQPKGPYAQAVKANGFLFVSGQGSLDPASGEVIHGTIEDETRLTIEDMKAVLAAGGCTLADVVKVTVFLEDMENFARMNAVFGEYFSDVKPARSTVQAKPPAGLQVEMEAIAVIPE